jgi:hypothetical protein
MMGRNWFVRAIEFCENRLPFTHGERYIVRFPSLDVNREQPAEELEKSMVPADVQREAMRAARERRT